MQQDFNIVVISLEDQLQRREKMRAEMERLGLAWEFLAAIPGKSINHQHPHYDQAKRIRMLGYDMRVNEIACFLSHRKAWQQCVREDKNTLILEDDIQMPTEEAQLQTLKATIRSLCQDISQSFIIRLGNGQLSQRAYALTPLHESVQLMRFQTDPSSAFAYLLSPRIAQTLLEHSERFFTPVDDFMWRGWEHNYPMLDISPHLVHTRAEENPSTIGDRKKPPITFFKKIRRELNQALERRLRKKYERETIVGLKNHPPT
jgi:glycosyl transferase family 25